MDVNFAPNSPLRLPRWRADRVLQLLEAQSRPSRRFCYDDHYVRAYRRFLLSYIVADNDRQRREACLDLPHVFQAHVLHHGPDQETRDVLQARLLTGESYPAVAARMAIAPAVVTYYEKIFFDVQERLGARDWVVKAVLGLPNQVAASKVGFLGQDMRGNLLRTVAYFGGDLALESILSNGISTRRPNDSSSAKPWLNNALLPFIETRALEAALCLEVNGRNVMRLLRLAARLGTSRKSRTNAGDSNDLNDRISKMFKDLDTAMRRGKPLPAETQSTTQ